MEVYFRGILGKKKRWRMVEIVVLVPILKLRFLVMHLQIWGFFFMTWLIQANKLLSICFLVMYSISVDVVSCFLWVFLSKLLNLDICVCVCVCFGGGFVLGIGVIYFCFLQRRKEMGGSGVESVLFLSWILRWSNPTYNLYLLTCHPLYFYLFLKGYKNGESWDLWFIDKKKINLFYLFYMSYFSTNLCLNKFKNNCYILLFMICT